MPTYDYECKCGHTGEGTVPFKDRDVAVVKCPKCGKPMRRLFSTPRFTPSRFPYVHDNIDMKPVYIKDKAQEKHEFEKRGLINVRGK